MIVAISVSAAVFVAGLVLTIYTVRRGVLGKKKSVSLPGNDAVYSPEKLRPSTTPLTGKSIYFLGSSVTLGSASGNVSFVEYISARNGCECLKEAVSGTTLVSSGKKSYIPRLRKMKGCAPDLFVCQLSTNDASQKKPLGSIESSGENTVCGAINTIIEYVQKRWNCPIVFYTNAYYKSAEYKKMVEAAKSICEKKEAVLIDLYTDVAFNDITEDKRALFMADKIHPTKAGYLLWWTPKIEETLFSYIK